MGLELKSVPAMLQAALGHPIAPEDYAGDLPATASGWSSWNRPLIALACHALESLRTKARSAVDGVLALLDQYFRLHPFMGGEPFTLIYVAWIAYPLWLLVALASWLGRADLVERWRLKLRALVAWAALAATRGPGRLLLDHNLDHMEKPRPLVTTGEKVGFRSVAWPGKRSYSRIDTDGDKARDQFAHLDTPVPGLILAQAARRPTTKKWGSWEFAIAATIAERFGGSPWFLTDGEAATLNAWLDNPSDESLARKLVEWAREWAPDLPFRIRRYARGVFGVCYRWTDSSTATLALHAEHDDGEGTLATPETGLRGAKGSGDEVAPGSATFLDAYRARAQRDDGRYTVEVTLDANHYGPWLFDVVAEGRDARLELAAGPVPIPTPPPAPAPPSTPGAPPPPKRKAKRSALEQLVDFLRGLFH